MAVNVVLNIRSDEEVLYLEPVELLYEGNKMWRRSARQVAKEIEAKRLLANKNNLNLSTTKTCELLLTPALKKSCLKKSQAPARRSSSLSSNASSK
uniref:Uncharacterized protein n=1 Tax=Panagrolaimus superbus TaxID=310955 RepID=A0A914YDX6_9BILA